MTNPLFEIQSTLVIHTLNNESPENVVTFLKENFPKTSQRAIIKTLGQVSSPCALANVNENIPKSLNKIITKTFGHISSSFALANSYENIPAIYLPDTSEETLAFAKQFYDSSRPYKPLVFLGKDATHLIPLMDIGFLANEMIFFETETDPETAILQINNYNEPFLNGYDKNGIITLPAYRIALETCSEFDGTINDIHFDSETGILNHTKTEQTARLTKQESVFLTTLLVNPDRLVTQKALLDAISQSETDQPEGKIVDVLKCKIIKKIESISPESASIIQPVRGMGYVFATGQYDLPFTPKGAKTAPAAAAIHTSPSKARNGEGRKPKQHKVFVFN